MTSRCRTAILTALCLTVAALCRFTRFDLIEFKYDEAQVSTDALALVRDHVIPQTSILTSGGFHNPPLMIYLTAIPMLVSTSPLVVTAFFTALNVLATGGLYLAGRRLFGEVAAWTAVLLYAVGPLAVHYSRKIWAPDAMPPFTVLLFAGLALGLGGGSAWWLAAALVALAVLVQLHQAAIILAPATVLLLLVFGSRLSWRRPAVWGGMLAGILAFVVLLFPYTRYESQHQFADVRGIAGQVGAHPALTFAPWRDLWWLVAGWNPQLFFAGLAAQEHPPLMGSSPLDWAVLLFGLAGAGACLVRLVRRDARPFAAGAGGGQRVAAATLLLLVFLPPVVITRSAAPVYPHYLVFLLPLLFLLEGIGLSTLAHAFRYLRVPAWTPPLVAVVVTATLSLAALLRLLTFDQQLVAHTNGGDYGIPLRYSLLAAQVMTTASPAKGARESPNTRAFLMATDGDAFAVYQYLVAAGIAPVAAAVQPEQALLLPPPVSGGAYLFTGAGSPAYQALRTLGAVSQPLPSVAPAYTILHLPGTARSDNLGRLGLSATPGGPFRLGPGLALTGTRVGLSGPNGPLTATLAWSVQDPAPFARQPVRLFLHLYDAGRHTVAQQDALGVAGSDWQAGDRLLTWFTLKPPAPLPPGRYTLVAGVYIVEGFHVFPVRGPNGEDLGGEIPLGTLIIGAP